VLHHPAIYERSYGTRSSSWRVSECSGLAFEGVFKLQALLEAAEPIYVPSASPSWTSPCCAMGSADAGGIVLLNATTQVDGCADVVCISVAK